MVLFLFCVSMFMVYKAVQFNNALRADNRQYCSWSRDILVRNGLATEEELDADDAILRKRERNTAIGVVVIFCGAVAWIAYCLWNAGVVKF